MNYKLILTDLDETLLDENKLISKENLASIKAASEMGIKFAIASSRAYKTLEYYKDILAIKPSVICYNGAYSIDEQGHIIENCYLSKELLLNIIKIADEHNIYYHFYKNGIMFSNRFEYGTKRFYNSNLSLDKKYKIEIRLLPDCKDYIENNNICLHKIVLMDNDIQKLQLLRKELSLINEIEFSKSSWNNMEIVKSGIDKGTALKKLCSYYNIPVESCIAVGNDENDIPMIKAAGLGVAVKNADSEVKILADYITENDNEHDAIAEVIKKFCL